MFFVLSGMLVGGQTLQRMRDGTFEARAYAADRIARIYVPLIPALLLGLAIVRVFELPFYPGRFAACLVGWQEIVVRTPDIDTPLWSLAYEIWFYVLAGCAAFIVCGEPGGRGWGRLAAWAGAALSLGLLCLPLDAHYLVCWLLGAAGFSLRDRLGKSVGGWVALAGAMGMWLGAAGFHRVFAGVLPALATADASLPVRSINDLILATGTLFLVAGVNSSAPSSRAAARLERAGSFPVAYSYSLYLVHCPVLILLMLLTNVLPPVKTGYSLLRMGCWIVL